MCQMLHKFNIKDERLCSINTIDQCYFLKLYFTEFHEKKKLLFKFYLIVKMSQ